MVMNIHAGVFPVNQSKRAEGGFMSPVVHFAVEGMCANSGSGHSITNFCCILFSAIFINGILFLPATCFPLFKSHIDRSHPYKRRNQSIVGIDPCLQY